MNKLAFLEGYLVKQSEGILDEPDPEIAKGIEQNEAASKARAAEVHKQAIKPAPSVNKAAEKEREAQVKQEKQDEAYQRAAAAPIKE